LGVLAVLLTVAVLTGINLPIVTNMRSPLCQNG
jgi:hypothetical protein